MAATPMSKKLIPFVVLSMLYACTHQEVKPTAETPTTSTPTTSTPTAQAPACIGSTTLPPALAGSFEPIEDNALLTKALGKENQGLLCQGQVYQSKAATKVNLFRAWNSTNPKSKFGNWWAFSMPDGKVADYRKDYEICYQWSPLDVLARCTLKPGTKVVIGTGQNAQCSQYLTYPVSTKQQVYIDNAEEALSDCSTYNGVFRWQ